MNDQLRRWRQQTAGCRRRVHLNNAGAALMPAPVVDAIERHLELETEIGGYEAADEARSDIAAAYDAIAELVGAAPRNIAVTENATVSFAQAVSAFDFSRGDIIVTTRNDYISNQLFFLSLSQRLGVEIVRAADLPEGGVDPESVRRAIAHPKCRLVAVTWIPTNSGLVQPVHDVGKICRERGVPYLVDACQAVGQMPVDVSELHCDFLAATARKFLRGPRGIGFLYVSDETLERGACPLYVDMRGARWVEADRFEPVADARRFENWEFAYALVLGMGAAARYALDVGLPTIQERVVALADQTQAALGELPGVRLLDRGTERCGLVTLEVRGRDGAEIVEALRQRGINTSTLHRGHAVIDMDEKGAATGVRISPHYYNTEEEVDTAVAAIAEILTSA